MMIRQLLALRGHTKGRLITLFGCGGDRDKEKRPQMARIAEEHSDEIIVTSDNPRKEDPLTIIQEICQGFSHKQPHIEPDRKKAIALGLSLLGKKDVLLIAGKGNETTQILAHGTIPFDDAAVVSSFM